MRDKERTIVIRLTRLAHPPTYPDRVIRTFSKRARVLWTLGNALMLFGVVLLLYVGGIYAQAEYDRYAARGDTELPVPQAISTPSDTEPAPFTMPSLNAVGGFSRDGQVTSAIPSSDQSTHRSTITRIVIPSIDVDSKVVEVGWDVKIQQGQQVAIWQVAEYAVGQHRGSRNPGEGGNIVLAGHVGGYGKVFKNLFSIKPGDQITLYSNGQQYLYTVQEHLLLTEEGVSVEQHIANARYIGPSDQEIVTLVTCWPAQGPHRFTQRVVIRARPFVTKIDQQHSNWSMR